MQLYWFSLSKNFPKFVSLISLNIFNALSTHTPQQYFFAGLKIRPECFTDSKGIVSCVISKMLSSLRESYKNENRHPVIMKYRYI